MAAMFKAHWLIPLGILLLTGCATVRQNKPPGPPEAAGPAPQTQTVPTPTPGPSKAQGLVTLAFTGDIMMGGSSAHKLKTEGPDSFFTKTAPFLKQADLVMGNLEGPLGLTGKNTVHKKYTFLVDPSAALGLAHAGYTLLTLANNHTMDFGPEALESTIQALDQQGLGHAGAGRDLAEARRPAFVEVKGRKVAVLAYSLTYPQEFWASKDRPGCAPADGYMMKEDIQAVRTQGADLVIVCCHWGQEKHTRLRSYQPNLAHLAIDAGADAVVGHHPHIWQGLEIYNGKPIAYAIGNFAFGTLTSIKDSGILYLTFDEKNQWVGGQVLPLNVYNHQVAFTPRPMGDKESVKFFLYLKGLSKGMDLRLVKDEYPEIRWATDDGKVAPNIDDLKPQAPKTSPPPAPSPVATVAPPLPTPTADTTQNPEGSVPGAGKP